MWVLDRCMPLVHVLVAAVMQFDMTMQEFTGVNALALK
jgi:hypothetical protein